jgi:hypothetical protein
MENTFMCEQVYAQLESLRSRVERGAKFLDNVIPGWAEYIDIDDLDLGHGYKCVLGQLSFNKYEAEN